MKHIDHIIKPCRIEWVDADPEDVVNDEVGVFEIADDAVLDAGVGGLPQQVAAEQEPRLNALAIQPS